MWRMAYGVERFAVARAAGVAEIGFDQLSMADGRVAMLAPAKLEPLCSVAPGRPSLYSTIV